MLRLVSLALAAGLAALGPGTTPATATMAAPLDGQTTKPWVGAHTGVLWKEKNQLIGGGKLSYSREFDNKVPKVGTEAWRKIPSPRHFYSVKPPGDDVDGFIAGRYDEALKPVISNLPRGTQVTMYHEPEDNMSGPTFAALLGHFKTVVKSVRPDVPVWYVAMAFQWQTNSKGHVTTNAGWIDAAKLADAVGVDVYASHGNFKTLADDPGFTRWWNEIKIPSGKTEWGVIERGITGKNGEAARVKILNDDWAFATSHGLRIYLYWDTGGDELTGPQETAAYRAIAAQGATP